jgi:acyl-CoA dehydrogenase
MSDRERQYVDFSMSPEEQQIIATVRSFIEREVMPYEPVVLRRALQGGPDDLTHEEYRNLQDKAKASGLWGVRTPEDLGGAGLSIAMQARIEAEKGRTFLHFDFGGSARPISLYWLNDEQKERYLKPVLAGEREACFALSEPGVGSDGRGIQTTAVRENGEWVINGEKTWISYGDQADFAVVLARTPKEPGDPGQISAFLVDRDAGWKSSPVEVMGRYFAASLSFSDVRVPEENLIGEVGRAFNSYAMRFIHLNRIILPMQAAGAMERLLSMGIEWSENRVTFGEPLSQRENIQWMIADGEVALRATKLLALHAADLADRGLDFRHAANAAKLFGCQAACKVADDVLQIHGSMGYAKELPVERFYRDLRIFRIFEGSDEMARMAISRDLYKRHVGIGAL